MSQQPEVGSLAEEAVKLAEALQEWAGNNISDGSPACRLCPLCQLIALVRQLKPQTLDQIGDQVDGLVRSLRTLLESVSSQGSSARRDPGMERIRLSEDEGDIPWE